MIDHHDLFQFTEDVKLDKDYKVSIDIDTNADKLAIRYTQLCQRVEILAAIEYARDIVVNNSVVWNEGLDNVVRKAPNEVLPGCDVFLVTMSIAIKLDEM